MNRLTDSARASNPSFCFSARCDRAKDALPHFYYTALPSKLNRQEDSRQGRGRAAYRRHRLRSSRWGQGREPKVSGSGCSECAASPACACFCLCVSDCVHVLSLSLFPPYPLFLSDLPTPLSHPPQALRTRTRLRKARSARPTQGSTLSRRPRVLELRCTPFFVLYH